MLCIGSGSSENTIAGRIYNPSLARIKYNQLNHAFPVHLERYDRNEHKQIIRKIRQIQIVAGDQNSDIAKITKNVQASIIKDKLENKSTQ